MKRKRFPWMLIVSMAALAGLGTVIGRTVLARPPSDARPSDRVAARRVVRPAQGRDERQPLPGPGLVAGNGIVEPADREIKVAGDLSGRITRVHVREGERVTGGAALVELERSAERAALRIARADLVVARAELDRVRAGLRREDRAAAAAEVRVARARAALSAGVARRTAALARRGGVSEDELDRARRAAAADRATVAVAEARLKAAQAGSTAVDIALAGARVRAAAARVGQARAALRRRTVRAPTAGEILQVKVRPGEFYQAGGTQPLLVLGDTRTLRVRMDVEERDIARVRPGDRAFVTADAFRGHRFAGRVVSVGRRMGRKNLRSDDPVERIDTKILEVLIELRETNGLVPGLRVMAYVGKSATAAAPAVLSRTAPARKAPGPAS